MPCRTKPLLLPALACLMLLVSCYRPPDTIDFSRSPRIFRGTYRDDIDLRVSSPNVSFSKDGTLLAMQQGDGFHAVQLWDLGEDQPVALIGEGLPAQAVTLMPDGDAVVGLLPGVNLQPGEVRIWDTATGEPLRNLPGRSPTCDNCQAVDVALSPDGTKVALLSQRAFPATPARGKSEISLFDVATGERLELISGALPEYDALRFSPDGAQIMAVSVGDSTLDEEPVMRATLWDLSGGRVRTLEQPLKGYRQEDAHMWQGGDPVAAEVYEDRLELISLVTGDTLHTLNLPVAGAYPYMLYANPDATRFLAQLDGTDAALWSLETDTLLATDDETQFLTGFSPDGRYALTTDGVALVLRNPDTLEVEKTLVNGEVLPLTITSEATYIDRSRYGVAGTIQFGSESVPFEGEVRGYEGEVYIQMSPIRGPELRAYFTYRGHDWQMFSYTGFGAVDPRSFALSEASGKAIGAREYDIQLEKLE